MVHPHEFSAAESAREAIDRVERGTSPAWTQFMHELLVEVARVTPIFRSGKLEEIRLRRGGPSTHEPRAMGALMRWGVRERIIEPTGEWLKSGQASNHNRPMMIWRSLICEVRLAPKVRRRRFDPRQAELAFDATNGAVIIPEAAE